MVGRHNGSIIAFCLHVTSNSYYKKHIAIHSQVQGQQYRTLTASKRLVAAAASGLPKVIFLAVAEAEGEGRKTSALEVEAKGEAEGVVFGI